METPLFETHHLAFNQHITYPDITIPMYSPAFFVGESGSGKTSLFRMFNRTLTPDSGDIRLFGEDIHNFEPIELRKKVLLVAQSVFLFDDTIKTNFDKFYDMTERPKLSETEIKNYLSLCHIDMPLGADCRVLSGGERQRVYLAIFLSFKPEVILLDEPISALDAGNKKIVMKNIITFCNENKISPLIISHDEKAMDRYAETIVRLG